jgi:hydrogenase/urease accessory protein HupE
MDGRNRELEARLDAVGWGVLFVAVGGVLLVPGLPSGAWLVAVGVVMVGASLVRLAVDLPVVWSTAVVGIAALVAGVAEVAGLENAAGPLVLVALGITLIGAAAYRAERTARLASAGPEGR